MFFLLCYGVTNLACFALKVASAPNFRPTFKYFSWQTALFGGLFCFVIMFLIDPLYAAISLALMIILFVVISLRAPVTPWGDVSQALIYHQVRKYLLRLDIRKEHVKFWRPQVLLLVSNPRSSYHLIDFVNDIKKSGMYMLGHIQVDEFGNESIDRQKRELASWLSFVDIAEIKSFVEITIAPTIRQGAQNLIMTSGLGSMRANTVVLGFFDDRLPEDNLSLGIIRKNKFFGRRRAVQDGLFRDVLNSLPRLRVSNSDQEMNPKDYVAIIKDCIMMGKNVCVTRNFQNLNKNYLEKGGYIDVWPVSASVVREGPLGPYDLTFLLILQLSCILHMVPYWESRTSIRVFSVTCENAADEEHNLINLLKELRIPAEVRMVHAIEDCDVTRNASGFSPTVNWYRTINHLIRTHSSEAYVVFTGLPHPPQDENMTEQFLQELSLLSENIPPVMMVYGRSPVVSTSL
ncbi:solute carrier family 12 member 9 [Exaiptasia diaphana]|uniref:Uncharacterized protein n=1 Tax=Exaiptasia diaphana TaxID=2652724 RepID=A0A913WTQ7_EXADI|nr:solute carrier family 12 member 9 [Exaiptasia diaphana]